MTDNFDDPFDVSIKVDADPQKSENPGYVVSSEEFQKIFGHSLRFSDFKLKFDPSKFNLLQAQAWIGHMSSESLRGICWRIFLGLLQGNSFEEWTFELNKQITDYDRLKKQVNPTLDSVSVDPLSSLSQEGGQLSEEWNKYYAKLEMGNLIAVDLDRLYMPGIEDEYFQTDIRKERLLSVLLVWALKHDKIAYRQGMHELEHFLRQIDPELCECLEDAYIQGQIYGLRWSRLLLGREFKLHHQHSLRIWDYMFASCFEASKGKGSELVLSELSSAQGSVSSASRAMTSAQIKDRYGSLTPLMGVLGDFMLAMLLHIREKLVTSDSNEILGLLMKYPPVQDVTPIMDLADMLRRGVLNCGAHLGVDSQPRASAGSGSSSPKSDSNFTPQRGATKASADRYRGLKPKSTPTSSTNPPAWLLTNPILPVLNNTKDSINQMGKKVTEQISAVSSAVNRGSSNLFHPHRSPSDSVDPLTGASTTSPSKPAVINGGVTTVNAADPLLGTTDVTIKPRALAPAASSSKVSPYQQPLDALAGGGGFGGTNVNTAMKSLTAFLSGSSPGVTQHDNLITGIAPQTNTSAVKLQTLSMTTQDVSKRLFDISSQMLLLQQLIAPDQDDVDGNGHQRVVQLSVEQVSELGGRLQCLAEVLSLSAAALAAGHTTVPVTTYDLKYPKPFDVLPIMDIDSDDDDELAGQIVRSKNVDSVTGIVTGNDDSNVRIDSLIDSIVDSCSSNIVSVDTDDSQEVSSFRVLAEGNPVSSGTEGHEVSV